MMGLQIFNSKGQSTYDERRMLFLTKKVNNKNTGTPPATPYPPSGWTKTTPQCFAFYLDETKDETLTFEYLTEPPMNLQNEAYGLQTFDSTGKKILSPERRPLQPKDLRVIRGTFSNSSADQTLSYLVGPANNNALLVMNYFWFTEYVYLLDDVQIYYHLVSMTITARLSGGNYFLDVHRQASSYDWEGGSGGPTQVGEMPFQVVAGLVGYPR